MAKFNLMIVDDEPEILRTIERYFQLEEEYSVVACSNPLNALDIIRNKKIDVVLSDIKMPELNGVDFLKEIKNIDGLIQVIMMTAYSTMDVAIRCMEEGANDLVLKPFESLDELKEIVDKSKENIKRWKTMIKKSYKS